MIFMIHIGVDSAPIAKKIISPNGTGKGEFVANLGVSVTTHNKDDFESAYEDAISEILGTYGLERKKRIYKGAHLLAQAMENAPTIISELLERLESEITHVDVYCAYYSQEYISIYGEAQGQRLSPAVFVKKTQGAFPHVCSWWYSQKYADIESPMYLEVDYFQTATTPGWKKLLSAAKMGITKLEFYFGGDECNPLISVADLILKLIRIYHYGTVDGRSLLRPLHEKCESFKGKRKIWFHNLGSRGFLIKATAPTLPLQAAIRPFIKHPIFFYSWNPGEKKSRLKAGFQWSPKYNVITAKASLERGGGKSFSFAEDTLFWDPNVDVIIPITKEDQEEIRQIEKYGYKLPKIIDSEKLLQTIKF